MGRLIDADALEREGWSLCRNYQQDKNTMVYEAKSIAEIHTAQPEIIRCKDCRWGREACGNIECFADLNAPTEYHGYEWFCPNGERRTDGSN